MTDVTDVKNVLELLQVQRYEASLAELNSTLVDILTNQADRDMTAISQAIAAALAALPAASGEAPQVSVPVTVQPADVVVRSDPWTSLDIDFKVNPNNGQITGMTLRRIQE